MNFHDEIAELGFEMLPDRRGSARRYTRRSNPFLLWWLIEHGDGNVELTFELELGEYLKAKGFSISVQDELSLLLFPGAEVRGPADARWVKTEMERAERQLASVDFLHGS